MRVTSDGWERLLEPKPFATMAPWILGNPPTCPYGFHSSATVLADSPPHPSGSAIIAALEAARIELVAALPDIVTSDGLLWPIARRGRPRLVRLCKEDEGIGICAGFHSTGKRAVLMMQQTGLMDSLNALRAMGMDYELPIVMLVGLQGKEPELPAALSKSHGVRIVPPILDVMDIKHIAIESPEDVELVAPAIDEAFDRSRPLCILIGRRPVA